MLACVFGAERLHQYVFGKHFVIESDHKPLEMITKESRTVAPAHLQRFLMRMQRFHFRIQYRPGKDMALTDSLSRLPTTQETLPDTTASDITILLIQFSHAKLEELRTAKKEDPVLSRLAQYRTRQDFQISAETLTLAQETTCLSGMS